MPSKMKSVILRWTEASDEEVDEDAVEVDKEIQQPKYGVE